MLVAAAVVAAAYMALAAAAAGTACTASAAAAAAAATGQGLLAHAHAYRGFLARGSLRVSMGPGMVGEAAVWAAETGAVELAEGVSASHFVHLPPLLRVAPGSQVAAAATEHTCHQSCGGPLAHHPRATWSASCCR